MLTALEFLPGTIITGWAYFRIIKRLIHIRKRIERTSSLRPSSTATNFDVVVDHETDGRPNRKAALEDSDEDDFDFSANEYCEIDHQASTNQKIDIQQEVASHTKQGEK